MNGFAWDWTYALSTLPDLLSGLKLTVIATFFGSIIAVVLGLLFCMLRMAQVPLLSAAIGFFIQLVRGTPLLIQLYFIFYVLPGWGLSLAAFATGVSALGVYYAAYTAEIFRAGIEEIAPGQWEASLTLGLPIRRVWTGVVLPQACLAVLPVIANMVIAMFKETALLSSITIMELLAQGKSIGSIHFRYVEPLTIVGILYFIVSYSAARMIRRLEGQHAIQR
ncbi:MAG: ectoine/hydroxyectoine ABC transporter permease subunit EhuD [Beijerinckiaceae bacterium]|nr:ectoine/hydroxyectoine ABC transporter permease subunit EhuD [Beijerinckiaceae bacterium]